MKQVLVLDVDGCLLKWQAWAVQFARENGICINAAISMQTCEDYILPFVGGSLSATEWIEKYNASKYIENLPAYVDAKLAIPKLAEKFDLVICTSLSDCKVDYSNRETNLLNLFGDVFHAHFHDSVRKTKRDMLESIYEKFGDRVFGFVDDQAKHLDVANEVFCGKIELFHMIRGTRESAKSCKTTIITDLGKVLK